MALDTPTLTIDELRADDPAAVEAAFEITRAVLAHDLPDFPPPCRFRHTARLHHAWPGRESQFFLASLDGTPAGFMELEISVLDNVDNVGLALNVHPEFRRHGVGRALFGHAAEVTRAGGRKRLFGQTSHALPDGPPRDDAGDRFAAALGAHAALGEVRRRLDLDTVDLAEHDRLLDEALAKAGGYSVVQWDSTTPEEHIDDVARLDSSFIDQAPMGDLAWEPEKVDADRIRRIDAVLLHYGARRYSTGLVHDETGRLVAWSLVGVRRGVPWHAWQGITLVDPRHRGHRLGLVAKLITLRRLRQREPQVRAIDTWNAEVNTHMIAINEAMGFRAVEAWTDWQVEV
jgi:GNAT superfamily N-acetyltransferase